MSALPIILIGVSAIVILITIILIAIVDIQTLKSRSETKSKSKSKSKKDSESKSKSTSNAKNKESKSTSKTKSKPSSNAKVKPRKKESNSNTKSKTSSNVRTESKISTTSSKLTPTTVSELEPRQKVPWLFIILLIVSIVVFIALIASVFLISYELAVEENMDTIVNATNTTLEMAGLKLDEINLNNFKKTIDSISEQLKTVSNSFTKNIGFDNVTKADGNYKDEIADTKDGVEKFVATMENLKTSFPTGCGSKTDLDENPVEFLDNVDDKRYDLKIASEPIGKVFDKMRTNLTSHANDQEKLDLGVSKIENHLIAMRSLLDHFRFDIENSENKRQEYRRNLIKLANQPDTQSNSKLFVSATCSSLIVCSIVAIICLFKPKFLSGKRSTVGLWVSLHIAALSTIIASVIVIFMNSSSITKFDCPLNNDNFGLSNFTSPFSHTTIHNISVCATSESKFYSVLGNSLLISSVNVFELLLIQEYKEKMLATVQNSSLSLQIPPQFLQNVKSIENVVKKLNALIGKKCLDDSDQKKLENYHQSLTVFLENTKTYTDTIMKFNTNAGDAGSFLRPLLDSTYDDIVQALQKKLDDLREKITTSDFSCNSMITSYSKTGHSICKILDTPLDLYYILIMVTIISCLGSLVLQTFVLKKLATVNVDVEPDSEPGTSSTLGAEAAQSSAPSALHESMISMIA